MVPVGAGEKWRKPISLTTVINGFRVAEGRSFGSWTGCAISALWRHTPRSGKLHQYCCTANKLFRDEALCLDQSGWIGGRYVLCVEKQWTMDSHEFICTGNHGPFTVFSSAWLCQQSSWNHNLSVVRPSVSQLSLNLTHGFLSNFSCGFPCAIRKFFSDF